MGERLEGQGSRLVFDDFFQLDKLRILEECFANPSVILKGGLHVDIQRP